jgi:hypothetical protein
MSDTNGRQVAPVIPGAGTGHREPYVAPGTAQAPNPAPSSGPDPVADVVQRELGELRELVDELRELVVTRFAEPARRQAIVLTATQPVVSDDVGSLSRSVGLINPTDITVYLGIATPAQPNRHAISVGARSAMVLPLAADDLQVGAAAADLAAGDALVQLLRFKTVQPFYMGALA